MKLRHPVLIRLVAAIGSLVIRLWMGTVRYRVETADGVHPHHAAAAGERFIYAFWHETMLCPQLGFRTVRGSSSRGAVAAVREMVKQHIGHLVVTPDGPRGPRQKVQPGLVYLAAKTGLAIVPVAVSFARAWRARSWDRFAIPWPGSRLTCLAGEPIHVPATADKDELERYRLEVEAAFVRLAGEADEMVARRRAA
jgi:lysophospholipid acyltransferase (LPLAT)-like uncharacterized protein